MYSLVLVVVHDLNKLNDVLNAWREAGAPAVTIHLYVKDVEDVFARAVEAGATVAAPLANAFWGDRLGQLQDPFGHVWAIATHKEDLSPEEINERAMKMFGG